MAVSSHFLPITDIQLPPKLPIDSVISSQTGGIRRHIGYPKPYEGNREADTG